MAKHDPKNFFAADIKNFRVNEEINFNVFIHLELNDHVVLYKRKGEVFDQKLIDKLKRFGIKNCQIHTSEKDAYEAYLNYKKNNPTGPESELKYGQGGSEQKGEGDTIQYGSESGSQTDEEQTINYGGNKTDAAATHANAEDVKKAEDFSASQSEQIMHDLLSSDEKKQEMGMEQGKEVLKTIMSPVNEDNMLFLDYIDTTQSEHSLRVAIYSILFAMGLGHNEKPLLHDLTVAALLHDIGLTQILPNVISIPQTKRPPAIQAHFSKHVQKTVELLKEIDYVPNNRVMTILQQNHEKFNGSGYPNKLESFRVDEYAQIISLADLIDTISQGYYDGTLRGLVDSIKLIAEFEKDKSFPQYFNPEFFSKVLSWLKNSGNEEFFNSATNLVEDAKKQVL